MIIGIDIGYSHTKTRSTENLSILPSVVGSNESSSFGLSPSDPPIIMIQDDDQRVLVGEGAVEQSRFIQRREDRSWIESSEYLTLFKAGLSDVIIHGEPDYKVDVNLITGLPVAYYSDKDKLRQILHKSHQVRRWNRWDSTVNIRSVRVVPQPFGTLFYTALTDNGQVHDRHLLTGRIGIIDVGGHTTNVLAVTESRDVFRLTDSIDTGSWEVIRSVRRDLQEVCPELQIRDHDLIKSIQEGVIFYYGRRVDIQPILDRHIPTFRDRIISVVSQLWNGGAMMDTILITGGGAHLVGGDLQRHFQRHADVRVVNDPVFANVEGYYRFGRYLEGRND